MLIEILKQCWSIYVKLEDYRKFISDFIGKFCIKNISRLVKNMWKLNHRFILSIE